jgi:hypothetical protein
MTLVTYSNGPGPSTAPIRRRRLTGTAHSGPHWVCAVRILRSATLNAVEHAGWRRSATADAVGTSIIDHIEELDAKSLHVLAVVFSMLVRASWPHECKVTICPDRKE